MFELVIPIIQIRKEELLKQKSNILTTDSFFDKEDQKGYEEFWSHAKPQLEYINAELKNIETLQAALVIEIRRVARRSFYLSLFVLLILISILCLVSYYFQP